MRDKWASAEHKARTAVLARNKNVKALLPQVFPSGARGRNRGGPVTAAEQGLVQQFVADQPIDPLPIQVTALATLLQRRENTIRAMITRAKEKFVSRAERYVDIHHEATEAALKDGDYEQALRGTQWAIANISAKGERIVEKPEAETGGTRVAIGIKVGGIDEAAVLKINEA